MFAQIGSSAAVTGKLFELPVGRWISWSRLALAGVALLASFADPAFDSGGHGARVMLIAFTIYSASLVVADPISSRFKHAVHAVDIAASASLMYVTDGSTSPFFLF